MCVHECEEEVYLGQPRPCGGLLGTRTWKAVVGVGGMGRERHEPWKS